MSQTPFHRALIVANPIAGLGRARKAAQEVSVGLERLGVASEVHLTSSRGDALALARAASGEVDLLVSVGGDGTLGEVLEGLSGRDVPVAILPVGTANVMSLDLGLPRGIDGLLDVIARGRTARLDTARVNRSRLSFLVTSVGFDAMAVRELEERRRGPISKTAYFTAGLRALVRYTPPSLSVEIDGQALPDRFALVLVSNIVHYGGYRVLSGDRHLDDGLYEVYLFAKGSRASLLGYGLRAAVAGLPGGSCTQVRGRRIRINSEVPVPCQVDGDSFGATPVEIAVDPVQSRLVVP